MTKEERLQELRKRKAYRREAELEDFEKEVGEYVSPAEKKPRVKKSYKPLTQAAKEHRKTKQSIQEAKASNKMKETLFIDEWHDTCEVLPDCGENVWFIFDGQIKVGMYEPMQRIFCMADGFGAELKDVRQWKYVGVNKQFLKYPKERQIIACSVVGYPCLVTGIFTDHCVDEDTYDETCAVILDEDYKGLDKVVDWKRVAYWFELTEKPFVVLDPVEDSILAVFPDTQTVITDDTGVVLDPPQSCDSDNCVETPYVDSDYIVAIEDDSESAENPTGDSIGTSQIAKAAKEENTEELSLKQEKVDDPVPVGDYMKDINSTVEGALKDYTSGDSKIKTQAGIGIKNAEKTVEKAIDSYTSKKESKEMDKLYKVTEAQMDIITDYNLKSKVKDWYVKAYPTDELGEEIDPDITFYDVFDCLDFHHDIYTCLDVSDSIVRERVFEKLAELIDCDYDYIYDQWLQCNDTPYVKDYSNTEENNTEYSEEEQINKIAKILGIESEIEKINKESEDKKNKVLSELDALVNKFKIDIKSAVDDITDEENSDKSEDLDECIKDKVSSLKDSVDVEDYNLGSLPKDIQESLIKYLAK